MIPHVDETTSKLASSTPSRRSQSPTRKSIFSPCSLARSRAVSIRTGARSIPTTSAPARAARSETAPVPHTRSSQRSPRFGLRRGTLTSWMSAIVTVTRWYGPLPHIALCRFFSSSYGISHSRDPALLTDTRPQGSCHARRRNGSYPSSMSTTPTQQIRVLYTAEATATGGRKGPGRTSDGRLDVDFSSPTEMGGDGGPGTNPEQLFATGFAACFQNAIMSVARRKNLAVDDSIVTARIGIGPVENRFGLTAELDLKLPSIHDRALAEELVSAAEKRCPYSNAVRGNIDVAITILEPTT